METLFQVNNGSSRVSTPPVTNAELAQQLAFQCRIGDGELEVTLFLSCCAIPNRTKDHTTTFELVDV